MTSGAFCDFTSGRTYKRHVRAEAAAKANGRDIIEPTDLPITKGLRDCVHAYREIDQAVELVPSLARPSCRHGFKEEAGQAIWVS